MDYRGKKGSWRKKELRIIQFLQQQTVMQDVSIALILSGISNSIIISIFFIFSPIRVYEKKDLVSPINLPTHFFKS